MVGLSAIKEVFIMQLILLILFFPIALPVLFLMLIFKFIAYMLHAFFAVDFFKWIAGKK